RAVQREAVDAVAADHGGHVELDDLAQPHGAHGREHRTVDRGPGLPRRRQLVPVAVRDGVNPPARVALRRRRAAGLETDGGASEWATRETAHPDPEERLLGRTGVDLEELVPAELRGGAPGEDR